MKTFIFSLFELGGPSFNAAETFTPIYGMKKSGDGGAGSGSSSGSGSATPTPNPQPTVITEKGADGLPKEVDLRHKFGPIRNQGKRGTCNFFGAIQLVDYVYGVEHSAGLLNWQYRLQVMGRSQSQKAVRWSDKGGYTIGIVPLLSPQGNPVATPYMPYIAPGQGAARETESPYKKDVPEAPTAALAAIPALGPPG